MLRSILPRRTFMTIVAAALLASAAPVASFAAAPGDYRVSGPYVHDNLAVYLIHGKSAAGTRTPTPLQEALDAGKIRVKETSDVNELIVENVSDEEIYIQSGDIVKGGKQDRVLTVSLVLPPKSGPVPIGSFCVEQGRWQQRGKEDVSKFNSAKSALPSKHAKLAMKAPGKPGQIAEPATSQRQNEVWRSVAQSQSKLADNVGAPVQDAKSKSSLQLTLENEKVQQAIAAAVKTLQPVAERDSDVIGFAFAINGEINSADVYVSNALFRKMWGKLLNAAAVEAVGDKRKDKPAQAAPASAAVLAFLDAAANGTRKVRTLNKYGKLDQRDAEKAYLFEAQRPSGEWVHRNYLAK
ncbi:MAG: DUF6569 family protein [Alphaproteobacteria bacterium]